MAGSSPVDLLAKQLFRERESGRRVQVHLEFVGSDRCSYLGAVDKSRLRNAWQQHATSPKTAPSQVARMSSTSATSPPWAEWGRFEGEAGMKLERTPLPKAEMVKSVPASTKGRDLVSPFLLLPLASRGRARGFLSTTAPVRLVALVTDELQHSNRCATGRCFILS